VALLRDKYADFGTTRASEKPLELDGIAVSRETVRRLQMELKLRKPERRRARRVFPLLERRLRFGELIQIDGSPQTGSKAGVLVARRSCSCVDGPLDARAKLRTLTGRSIAIMCPAC